MANLTDIRSNWSTGASEGGVTVYATKENLPTTGLTSGDQAYVTNTSRLYISNGSGWYNVALINATPSLTIDPAGSITLAKDGSTPTVITLTATDSDNAVDGLTFSVDSDGSFAGLGTISQDSSVFTITPFSEDSATTTSSTLTFKASDGISFGSGQRTLSLTFSAPNSNYTTFLAKADTAGTDNQVDASTSARAITEVGNVTSSAFSPYHPGGYSNYVTSSGSGYVEWTSPPTFSATAWCVETWFKPDGMPSVAVGTGGHWSIFGCWTANTNNKEFLLLGGSSGEIRFYYSFDGSAAAYVDTASGVFSANTWVHLALSFDGTNYTLYADGVNVARLVNSTQIANKSSPLAFGKSIDGAGSTQTYVTGWYADGRVINGSTLESNNTFPVPTSRIDYSVANTQAVFHNKPHIRQTLTYSGSATIKRAGPYDYLGYAKADHGGSVYFDGSGDYLTTPTSVDFAYGTGDFTIEAWVYIPSAPASYKYILGQSTVSTGLGLYIQSGVYKVYGGGALIVQSSVAYKTNVWEHIAIARSGTTLKMFLNGAEVGSATNSLNAASGSSNGLTIGRWVEAPDSQAWLGYIADVRVIKGTALYTSAFTAPTQPLTAISGTSLLTCTNTNDIWDAGTGKALTKFGNATVSNTYRRFTTSSAISFDGSGDYVGWDENGTYFYGSNDQTVEMWVYPNANSNYQTLFSMNRGTSTGFNFGIDGSSRPFLWKGNFRIQAGTVSNTTWSHVALVRYNGVWSIYVNGTSVGATWSDTTTYTGQDFAIGDTVASGGGATGEWFNGYMQNVRVTKGLARYTTNFTPQTSEFDG